VGGRRRTLVERRRLCNGVGVAVGAEDVLLVLRRELLVLLEGSGLTVGRLRLRGLVLLRLLEVLRRSLRNRGRSLLLLLR
jgi:hypothetical protein